MMVLSYATLLHQPTVGIDDTAFDIYYEEGVSPAMGRWCLYLINKFFPLAYKPYFVEAIGLLLICLSERLWCLVSGSRSGDIFSLGEPSFPGPCFEWWWCGICRMAFIWAMVSQPCRFCAWEKQWGKAWMKGRLLRYRARVFVICSKSIMAWEYWFAQLVQNGC